MTQNNLGNALRAQAGRSEGADATRLLGEAVTAYKNALTIFVVDQFPNQHSIVTRNLTVALEMIQKLNR